MGLATGRQTKIYSERRLRGAYLLVLLVLFSALFSATLGVSAKKATLLMARR